MKYRAVFLFESFRKRFNRLLRKALRLNRYIYNSQLMKKSMKKFKLAVEACLACFGACELCAALCIEMNDKNHQRCIALCRDCAEICILCVKFCSRNSTFSSGLIKLCAKICTACALECEKFSHHPHCKECAEACRKCAAVCSFKW